MENEVEFEFAEKKLEYEEEEKIHHHSGFNYYLKIQWIRWPLLFMLCLIEAGNTSAIESPSSLQSYLQHKDMNLTTVEYEVFFSITYATLGVATLTMGYLINIIGPINGLIICLLSHTVSQILFSLGASFKMVGLMYFARVFSGIGETNFMCYTAIVEIWFKNMEVSLAFSLLTTIGRSLAYAINYTLPRVREATGSLFITFFYSSMITLTILGNSLLMRYIDSKYVEQVKYHEEGEIVASSLKEYVSKTCSIFRKVAKNTSYMVILIVSAHISTNKVIFMLNSNEQLVSVFGYTPPTAAHFNLVSYAVASVFSLLLSVFIFDKYGYRLVGLVMCELFLMGCYLSINYFPQDGKNLPYISFFLFGLGAAFQFGTVWPCANSLIDPHLIPSATGLVYCLISILMFVHVLVYGVVRDATMDTRKGFFYANLYTLFISSIGFFFNLVLFYRNWKGKGKLNHIVMREFTEEEKRLFKQKMDEVNQTEENIKVENNKEKEDEKKS